MKELSIEDVFEVLRANGACSFAEIARKLIDGYFSQESYEAMYNKAKILVKKYNESTNIPKILKQRVNGEWKYSLEVSVQQSNAVGKDDVEDATRSSRVSLSKHKEPCTLEVHSIPGNVRVSLVVSSMHTFDSMIAQLRGLASISLR